MGILALFTCKKYMTHSKFTGKNARIRLGLALAGTLFAATSAHATTLEYDFVELLGSSSTSNYGNVVTFSNYQASNGLTMKATAWATTASGGKFATAFLPQFQSAGYGLGNCNQNFSISSCNGDLANHQVDNVSGLYEFILFQFSKPVDLDRFSINPYNPTTGYDRDVTYYLGNATYGVNLAGLTIAGLTGAGFTTRIDSDSSVSDSARTVIDAGLVKVNSILIGARVVGGSPINDNIIDRFKIDSIQVITTPEPGTFALVGLALIGIGLARRRPKAS